MEYITDVVLFNVNDSWLVRFVHKERQNDETKKVGWDDFGPFDSKEEADQTAKEGIAAFNDLNKKRQGYK
jgi:hypothetical protein